MFEIFINLYSHNHLDCIAWKRIKKQRQKEGEAKNEQDLEDGPLVVVPDDVLDGLERVQEPHG